MGDWLERRIGRPSFGAVMLVMLVVFFFAAATNTLSGWLYAMSGLGVAFLVLGLVGPLWELRGLQVARSPLFPISVGESTNVSLTVAGFSPMGLLQLEDCTAPALSVKDKTLLALEELPATVVYELTPERRGIYHWDAVYIRSAAPLGLFWRRVERSAPAELVVYPRIWALGRSLLLEQLGRSRLRPQQLAQRWSAHPTQGVTRSVRPYRWGDPMRWVHWRTSARLGQLQVREWEQPRAGDEVYFILDTSLPWEPIALETAIEAVASLFIHGQRQQLQVALLTSTGPLSSREQVLGYLAGVQTDTPTPTTFPTDGTILWFSPQPPPAQENMLWIAVEIATAPICLVTDQPLGPQLERVSLNLNV